MNTVTIIGHLTREPKTGKTKNENAWAFFTLKTCEEKPVYVDCSAWSEVATEIGTLGKESKIAIRGRVDASKRKVGEQEIWVNKVLAKELKVMDRKPPEGRATEENPFDDDVDASEVPF